MIQWLTFVFVFPFSLIHIYIYFFPPDFYFYFLFLHFCLFWAELCKCYIIVLKLATGVKVKVYFSGDWKFVYLKIVVCIIILSICGVEFIYIVGGVYIYVNILCVLFI